jgi:putative DNA primase/helicase
MNHDTIREAHGRWREILPALGLPASILTGKHQPCPMCNGVDRFRFTDRTREGDYFCSQCGAGKGMKLLQGFTGWDFRRAACEIDKIIGNLPPPSDNQLFCDTQAANPGALRRLYKSSEPVEIDTIAARYLRKRGIHGPYPKALRSINKIAHKPSGTTQCGILAVFSDADGRPSTIHRTFLTPEGKKADVDPVRMFMPGKVPLGGAIRLGGPAQIMGIAEGFETALAASSLFDLTVWATTSAALLERWQPPETATYIRIFADGDLNFVGQAAAYALAKRLVHESQRDGIKRYIDVMVPGGRDQDWNDVLMERFETKAEVHHV